MHFNFVIDKYFSSKIPVYAKKSFENRKHLKNNFKFIKNMFNLFFHEILKLCMFFNRKINEIRILINDKSYREIPGFFKTSRNTSRTKNEPENPGN